MALTREEQEWLRWRCMTDLFWLAKHVLGYTRMVEEVHRPLCDVFVHKDPGFHCASCGTRYLPDVEYKPGMELEAARRQFGATSEVGENATAPAGPQLVAKRPPVERALFGKCRCGGELARKAIEDQDEIKERLVFYPRGTFKTSIDICDVVQWILCFPEEITIQILTGDEDLSAAMQSEAVGHFVMHDTPTTLQQLFPEVFVASDRGTSEEFVCPLRREGAAAGKKDPTLRSSSILASAAGWHPWVEKFDDIVTETNSDSEYMLAKINTRRNAVRPLLRIGGYADQIGTTYNASDANCTILSEAVTAAGMAKPPEWGETRIGELLYFARPAWEVTAEAKAKGLGKPDRIRELTESDVALLFPVDGLGKPQQTFKFLRAMLTPSKERLLWAQYLLDPYAAAGAIITRDEMEALRVPWDQLPQPGRGYTVLWWDLAYNKKNAKWVRDYTVGAYCQVVDGRIYVLRIIRGKFLPDDTAYQIVRSATAVQPDRHCIEDTLGSRYLENDMRRHAADLGRELKIEWVTIDVTDQAKLLRFNELQPLVRTKRLLFADTIEYWNEIVEEFTQFKTIRHKDIADAIAQINQKFVGNSAVVKTQQQVDDELRRKDAYERAYGLGQHARQPEPAAAAATPYGLDDILGGLNG